MKKYITMSEQEYNLKQSQKRTTQNMFVSFLIILGGACLLIAFIAHIMGALT